MKVNVRTSFIDLLFIMAFGFALLFAIAFILINPISKKTADIVSKDEFLITLTWDSEIADDIDLWVKAPNNEVVGFSIKDANIGNLDHDDRGTEGDTFVIDGEMHYIKNNEEKITIRYPYPGRYYVNVHYYSKYQPNPVEVTVTLFDIYKQKKEMVRKITISEPREEVTIFSFSFNEDLRVHQISKEEQVLFVNKLQEASE